MTNDERFLTRRQFRERYGFSDRTANRIMAQVGFPKIRIPGLKGPRIPEAALREWIAANQREEGGVQDQ